MDVIAKALNKANTENAPRQEQQVSQPFLTLAKSRTKRLSPDPKDMEANRVLTSLSDQGILDAYNMLRTHILQITRPHGWNSLMITSVGPGEGKTTTAINLAISLARDAQQTSLLVDCQLRDPKVGAYLGLGTEQGLTDHLLDNANIQDLLINPGIDQFVVMPAGRKTVTSTDLLSSPRVKTMVDEFRTRYPDRYVIYDCPHLLNIPDALVFSGYVDGIILVVQADTTPKQDIENALGMLEETNVIGLVLNNVQQ